MYLANLKLWNFRKFGTDSFEIDKPDLDLNFNENLNVLIGENDSGKTAIIDAIKIVLKTHSYEWIRVTEDDFYTNSDRFRIELIFKGFDDKGYDAKYFTEWLSWEGEGDSAKPFLRVIYDVSRTSDRILPADIRGGNDEDGFPLSAEARYYLKTTYLKPLRDAQSELIPKRYSRLSQILKEHDVFKEEKDNFLYEQFIGFNETISSFFEFSEKMDEDDLTREKQGVKIKKIIDEFIQGFYDKDSKSQFKTSDANLKSILENLELSILDTQNPGLGTLNRLFMAVELLHLNKNNWDGLRLGLIEELEAHLHPQVQMKVIDTLQKNSEENNIQLILTTHSPNLASKIKLENLIICKNNNAFPMGSKHTELKDTEYIFLEHFLDVTKANLFFAKGVILVEGWSEEILIPALTQAIGYDLTENEVSVINVGNIGFFHYYKIYLRRDNPNKINLPIAIVGDVDIREYSKDGDNISKNNEEEYKEECDEAKEKIKKKVLEYESIDGDIRHQTIIQPFISTEWTLEWCLYKSKILSDLFKEVIKEIHPVIFGEENTFEEELALRLLSTSKTINKTEIAYRLAEILKKTNIELDNVDTDDTIYYLIEAIKYVCE